MREISFCIRDRGEARKEADASRFREGLEWWRTRWMEQEVNYTILEQGKEEPKMNNEDKLRMQTAGWKLDSIVELAEQQNKADSKMDSVESKRIFREIMNLAPQYGLAERLKGTWRPEVHLELSMEPQVVISFQLIRLTNYYRWIPSLLYRTSGAQWVEYKTVRRQKNAMLRFVKKVRFATVVTCIK